MQYTDAISSMAVDDVSRCVAFYRDVLDLTVQPADMPGLAVVRLPGGAAVLLYPKADHAPAAFTVLNLVVDDIDAAVDELAARGVVFERYGEQLGQDAKGVMRGRASGRGPDQAWFTDPAGNILSVYA